MVDDAHCDFVWIMVGMFTLEPIVVLIFLIAAALTMLTALWTPKKPRN